MNELTIYECKYSKKRFDSKDECSAWERIELLAHLNRKIRKVKKESVEKSFLDNLKSLDESFVRYLEEWQNRNNYCDFRLSNNLGINYDSLENFNPGSYHPAVEDLKRKGYNEGFIINFAGTIERPAEFTHYSSMYPDKIQTHRFIYEYFYNHSFSSLIHKPKDVFYLTSVQNRSRIKEEDPSNKFYINLFIPATAVPRITAKYILENRV